MTLDLAALQFQPTPQGPPLTPLQRRFNALLAEVAAARDLLADWQARVERLHQAAEPHRRGLHAAWRDWVFALDHASWQPGLSRAEQDHLSAMLRETATALLAAAPDEALATLLARHGETPTASAAAPAPAAAASTCPPAAHEEPGDGLDDWERQAQAAAAAREQRAARRRSAAADKRRREAAQQGSQSLREVYRRLASALHPDREPDAQERLRKTALMQQANRAYAEGDLLELLALQLQAAQVEAARRAGSDPKRLQHQVTLLEEQLAELRTDAQRLESSFRAATGASPGSGLAPHKADRLITALVQQLREEQVLLQRQAVLLRDVDSTRSWLRQVRQV